jgi:hypothetical protein
LPNPLTLCVASTWDGQPAAPSEVATITLTAGTAGLGIKVDAPFHGDPPPPTAPGPTWGLWRFEVVELFLLGDEGRYTELELGPHGHHLLLQLQGTRHTLRHSTPLAFTAQVDGDRWSGGLTLAWALLPPGPLRANAHAIHGPADGRRHLAWTPSPGDAPDFHRLDQFRPTGLSRP